MNTIRKALATATIIVTLIVGVPPASTAVPGPVERPIGAPMLFDIVDRAACARGMVNHEIIGYTAKKQYGLDFYGRVSLTCGFEKAGFKHIKIDHADDWQRMLTKYGGRGSWDDFMSFATSRALAAPSLVRNVGNGKYCYTTPIQIYQGGKLVKTFYPKVIVSTTTRTVITSMPTNKGC